MLGRELTAVDLHVILEGALSPGAIDQNEDLNISDVFDAISIADPSFGAGATVDANMARPRGTGPYVHIVEQPASKALRFRYECEGRSAGSIPGANSTNERKTHPTIEICGHKGKAIIVVSCVCKEEVEPGLYKYRPHPHNLVGREKCSRGVCTVKTDVTVDNQQVSFSNLGIQCVKRKDIAEALKTREELRVDPYRTGFAHKSQPQSIDLNAVRLCFQVFIPDEHNKIRLALDPVVSEIIYDKKAMCDLQIHRTSHYSGTARGGTEMILLCEKVTREETTVVFVQRENNQIVWEESANILAVHKQVAIAFTAPPYRNPHTREQVTVFFQLKRVTDNARSNEIQFEYIPEYADSDYLKNKRRKTMVPSLLQPAYDDRGYMPDQKIKLEPKDKTPPHHMANSPLRVFTSPEHNYQQWPHLATLDNTQGGMNIQGPSHSMNPFNAPEMPWPPNYGQPMVQMQPQTVSPNMQAMSPNLQAMSPNMQAMSPNMQAMSPNMQAMSPHMQVMSPMGHGAVSPNHMGHTSPQHNMGHISPNLIQQQNLQQIPQHQIPQQVMEINSTPSITGLLMDRTDDLPQLNSGELSGFSSFLDQRPDLSDSLNRLSTGELRELTESVISHHN